MEITFATGAAGFDEARALLAIAHTATAAELSASREIQVLDHLKSESERALERPEFAHLRATLDSERARLASESWWRRAKPSPRPSG